MGRNAQHDQPFQTISSVTTQSRIDQTNLGRIVDGSTPKNRGIKQIITCRGGRVPESFHRSPCSVVAALVPLAQKRSKFSLQISLIIMITIMKMSGF